MLCLLLMVFTFPLTWGEPERAPNTQETGSGVLYPFYIVLLIQL